MAARQDLDLSIGKLDGRLPFEWSLHQVSCRHKNHETPLSFESVKCRISIFPLWRQHLECTYLKGSKGKYGELPFEVKAAGWLDLEGKKSIKISNFSLEGEEFFVHMEGQISPDLTLQKGNLSFYLPQLELLPTLDLKGSLIGTGEVTKTSAKVRCLCEDLLIKEIPFRSSVLSFEAEKKTHLWVGQTQFEGGPAALPVESQFSFQFAPKEKLVAIDDFTLKGPQTEIFGKLTSIPRFNVYRGLSSANVSI